MDLGPEPRRLHCPCSDTKILGNRGTRCACAPHLIRLCRLYCFRLPHDLLAMTPARATSAAAWSPWPAAPVQRHRHLLHQSNCLRGSWPAVLEPHGPQRQHDLGDPVVPLGFESIVGVDVWGELSELGQIASRLPTLAPAPASKLGEGSTVQTSGLEHTHLSAASAAEWASLGPLIDAGPQST